VTIRPAASLLPKMSAQFQLTIRKPAICKLTICKLTIGKSAALVFLLVAAVCCCAQSREPANQTPDQGPSQIGQSAPSANPEPQSSSEQPAPVPVLLDGTVTSLALSSELERTNYWTGGIAAGATYDDNILSSPSGSTGGASFSLMPFIAIDQSRARMHANLSYAAGFVANQHLAPQTSYAHNLGAEFDYRLSPHVDLRMQDHFSVTTNFYDQLALEPVTSGTGTLQQPNQSVITPLARQISNLADAEITYQFSPGDMVGASATFYNLTFRDIPAGTTLDLLDTQTQKISAFYSHRLTTRNWAGVTYSYQHLSFDPAVQDANTSSFLLFDTMYLTRKLTFSVFAGPEVSEVDSNVVTFPPGVVSDVPPIFAVTSPVSERRTLVAGGATLSWRDQRNSVQAGVSRQVNDGGGILGVVELNTADLAWRRRISQFTTLSLAAVYGDNTALGALVGGPAQLQAASASVSLEHQLRHSLMVTLGYARDYQRESGIVSPPADVDHNRGWITVSYSFTRPIGR